MAYPDIHLERSNKVRFRRKLQPQDELLLRPLASSTAILPSVFVAHNRNIKRKQTRYQLQKLPERNVRPLAPSIAPLTAYYNLPIPPRLTTHYRLVTPFSLLSATTSGTAITLRGLGLTSSITSNGVGVSSAMGNDTIGLDNTSI